jgi:hypothetical protein
MPKNSSKTFGYLKTEKFARASTLQGKLSISIFRIILIFFVKNRSEILKYLGTFFAMNIPMILYYIFIVPVIINFF